MDTPARRGADARGPRPPGRPDDWEGEPWSVRAAVGRALGRQRQDALDDIATILDAALRVAVRVAPAEPKVSDIVAEAGMSNQTFYRYFAGKDDLLYALLERGILRIRSYLAHQMGKHADPAGQVAAWVEGLLTQLTRPGVARPSITVSRLAAHTSAGRGRAALHDQLGELLVEPLAAAGRAAPDLDARVIQHAVVGVLHRHVLEETVPDEAERLHLIGFCVRLLEPSGSAPAPGARPTSDRRPEKNLT